MREIISLDEGWLFHEGAIPFRIPEEKGPVYSQAKTERRNIGPAARLYNDRPDDYQLQRLYNDERWIPVNLPHDYTIAHTPDGHENNALGYLPKTEGWYRKHFTLTEEDKDRRITVLFEGVSTLCEVYLNGTPMVYHRSAYDSFEIDLTDMLEYDGRDNVLAVHTMLSEFEGWWYQGGGIYRHVWLRKTERTAIDLWGVYAFPIWEQGDCWRIPAEVTVRNDDYAPHRLRFRMRFLAPDGTVLTEGSGEAETEPRSRQTLRAELTARNPLLWDPTQPHLYTVQTELYSDGCDIAADCDTLRTGFRTVTMDADRGLFLNGRPLKLKGVCGHQDFGLTGLAVPDNIYRYKVRLLREMGANGFRTSHYMHPAAFMDALDEAGFLVMDETRWFDASEDSLRQLETLVLRDRNRPSVILWSTGNEEYTHLTETGRRIQKNMAARIRQLDRTRAISCAISQSPLQATVADDCDAIGLNYNLDAFDSMHEKYPARPIFSSENCATSSTRGWYYDNSPARGYMSAYDHDTNAWFRGRELTWRFFMERPYVLGGYQWDSFEHRGESYWPRLCSQAGAIDLFYQRKDAFYQNQSLWTEQPMAHILPHWNWQGMEGRPIRISVYTNCDALELFLNGVSLGRQSIEAYSHGEWQVDYAPGELRVVGFRGGMAAAEDSVRTSGKAARLTLRQDCPAEPNGRDIALFTCCCVDENGVPVPDASPEVAFAVSETAEIVGTGSGVCDHVPPSSPIRKMWAGSITVGVRMRPECKRLRLIAEADGLCRAVEDFTV